MLTLFPAIMFVDWNRMKPCKDGKEHAKAVRSRASKQGWKKRRSLGEFEKLVSNAGRKP